MRRSWARRCWQNTERRTRRFHCAQNRQILSSNYGKKCSRNSARQDVSRSSRNKERDLAWIGRTNAGNKDRDSVLSAVASSATTNRNKRIAGPKSNAPSRFRTVSNTRRTTPSAVIGLSYSSHNSTYQLDGIRFAFPIHAPYKPFYQNDFRYEFSRLNQVRAEPDVFPG